MQVRQGYALYWVKPILPTALLIALLLAPPPSRAERREAHVIEVHDGDTVTLSIEGKRYRSRLIGIDAPESGQQPWGDHARDYLRKLLKESRRKVFVENDIVMFDKYQRLLVYLWTGEKEMVNEELLHRGYAVLFTIQPNSRYAGRFRKAQADARTRKSGIWGPGGLQESPFEYKKNHPRRQ